VATILLVVATIADLALAALLVAVSGFIFGTGPESTHAGNLAAAGYIAAVVGCVVAPVAGFVLNRRGKPGAGVAAAWLPVAGALVAMALPAPY
jgi:hypothetical protein